MSLHGFSLLPYFRKSLHFIHIHQMLGAHLRLEFISSDCLHFLLHPYSQLYDLEYSAIACPPNS